MGLRLRLILVLAIPLVLVVGVYGLWRIRIERAELLAETERNLALTAKAIQIAVENALRDRQIGDVRQLLAEIVSGQEQIDRIRVFDARGAALLVSNPLPIGDDVPEEAIRGVLRYGMPEWFYSRRGKQPVLYYIVPLRDRRNRIDGAIEIVQLASAVENRVRDAAWDVAIRLGAVLSLVALLSGLMLQRQVLLPLARLLDGIRRLGQGEAAAPLPIERRDELGRVAAAFNEMAEQLDAARRRLLEETERALDLERQLRHAQTLAVAGRLATSLAHEVGTPLNIISGRAETLLQGLPRDDRRREELSVIIGQIDRISGIIRSLLAAVRPDRPKIEEVDLVGGVLERVLPLLRHAARRRAVALEADVPPDVGRVLADANQLQQLVINLVMNGVEAIADGGTVRVEAARAESDGRPGVRLSVRDTGPGIPADLRARVFEPFFTTKPPGQGTGLGLTICRDIAREHGGYIEAGEAPGGGAVVSVWLPAAARA
jgi:signal transduction histidine kinase